MAETELAEFLRTHEGPHAVDGDAWTDSKHPSNSEKQSGRTAKIRQGDAGERRK